MPFTRSGFDLDFAWTAPAGCAYIEVVSPSLSRASRHGLQAVVVWASSLVCAAAPSDSAVRADSSRPAAPAPIVMPNVRALNLENSLWKEFAKVTKDIHAPLIKASELMKIIDDTNLVLIDVREPQEQAVSMLPHALSTAEFAEKFKHGIPKDKRLVVYCTIGYRSGKYAEQLAKQDITAQNLAGGVLAWSHIAGDFFAKDAAGRPVKTTRVHVYDKSWNFLHPDYRATW